MSIPYSLQGVLFDLDGVLVDSRGPIARSINFALEACGLSARPEAALHARIGDSLHAIFVDLLREAGADPARAPECIARYRELYREVSLTETHLVPGIESLLASLAERLPLAVATSKPVAFAGPILERLGITGRFAAVVGPALVPGEAETKRETAGRALAALGLAPGAAAALVGDRHHDVTAARALGIAAVGVRWGCGSEAELREAGADWIVAAPEELGRLLLGRAR